MKPTRRPSLNDLRAFEAVARLGSVRAAADELALTHGAVSRRVAKLADDLGLALVEPAGRGLRVTAGGQLLASTMQRALALIQDTIDTLQARDTRRPLVLSCERSVAMRWLIPRLSAFQDRHPQIELHLSVGGGPLDFARDQATLALRRLDFPVHPDWIVTPLMAENMVRSWPRRRRPRSRPATTWRCPRAPGRAPGTTGWTRRQGGPPRAPRAAWIIIS